MITVTSVEAQNRFGELIDRSQREPVEVTRRGRTVASCHYPYLGAAETGTGHGAAKLVKFALITTDRGEYRWARRLLASFVGGS
jgi:hypothetical protein